MTAADLLAAAREASQAEPGRTGRPWARSAKLVDDYITQRIGEVGESRPAGPFCVAALGGYGRAELCPRSDVDLLVLVETHAPGLDEFCAALLHPFWDAGFDVGHGVRTVRECIDLAREDLPASTALLDARFLAGEETLFAGLRKRFLADLQSRAETLVELLREDGVARAARFGDAAVSLTPELKHARGSLRDAQTLVWIDRCCGDILSDADRMELAAAVETLLRGRCAVQRTSRRKRDRVVLEEAPDYAEACGIDAASPALAAEIWLAEVNDAAAVIRAAWQAFWPDWERRSGRPVAALPPLDPDPAPSEAWRFVRTIAERGLPPDLAARRTIRDAVPIIAASLDLDELAGVALEPYGFLALETMLESGWLSTALPEFGRARNVVQFDGFHTRPLGRHSLEAIRLVALLLRGEDSLVAEFADRVEEPRDLVLAALLHDLGKPAPEHERAGAALARDVLRRRGFPEERVRRVAHLVEHHLLLSLTALKRDLADEAVIARTAAIAGSRERLAELLVLTVADARATGPAAWNDWLAALLGELSGKLDRMLAIGPLAQPHAAQALMAARDRIRTLAREDFDSREVEAWLDRMPPRYLMARDPAEVVTHLGLIREFHAAYEEDVRRKLKGRGGLGINRLAAEALPRGDIWRLSVVTRDAPGLFATVAGVLALHQVELLDAEIATFSDGTAVDVFTVGSLPEALFPEELFARVSINIHAAFTGRLDLAYRLAEKRSSPLAPPEPEGPPPHVTVDDELSDFHTVIEVLAPNRLGVVYDMACVLRDAGVEIEQAKLAARGAVTAITCFMRQRQGGKLSAARGREVADSVLRAVRSRE